MASQSTDLERGLALLPLEVRCGRGAGTILMTQQGDFVFKPHPGRGGLLNWIVGLLRPIKPQHVPADQLLGAKLESPTAITVWYAPGFTQKTGCVTRQRFRLHSTPRFETPDTAAAAALVDHIRRASSWWGRSRPPHVAAIVNPVSGRGTSRRMFESRLLPLLRDVAGLRVTVHVTQARMHAADLVREMRLRPPGPSAGGGSAAGAAAAGPAGAGGGGGGGYQPPVEATRQGEGQGQGQEQDEGVDLLMFVGGDGTMYEGLQGLFQRSDWDTARLVPMAAVPCGSGNGLAASSGLWDPVTAAVAVCRGRQAPIDVASVLQPPGNRFYCVLSVVYGAMANLDIGTNHLRWMGEMRFHLGGLRELIRGRCYSCRVFVLPPADDPTTKDAAAFAASTTPASASATVPPGMAATASGTAGSRGGDGVVDFGEVRLAPMQAAGGSGSAAAVGSAGGGADRGPGAGMEERLLPSGTAANTDSATARYSGGAAVGRGGGGGAMGAGLRLEDYVDGPPLPLLSQLPSLPSPLPDSPSSLPPGWVQLADAFAIFGAYNTQYLALGARSNPGGRMADGAWDVWHLEAEGSRASSSLRKRCLKVLLGVEDGSFAATPGVMSVIKARAMMFEQRDSATWTVLDGEEVPDLPLYMEVHPGLCRMLVAPGFTEGGL